MQGGRRTLVLVSIRRSVMGALGGVGIRSGVLSLALASSMKSVIDGKGHIVSGLSVSRRCSNTNTDAAAVTVAAAGAGAGDATGDG